MSTIYEINAKIFKAFCDDNRLRILELLQNGEKCACTLQEALPIGQSTLSHHMKILVESGIVETRKDGKWIHYSLSSQGTIIAVETLNKILTKQDTDSVECICVTGEES